MSAAATSQKQSQMTVTRVKKGVCVWGNQCSKALNIFSVIAYAQLYSNSARGSTYSCAGYVKESQISHCSSEAPFALSYHTPALTFPLPLVLWTLKMIHPLMQIISLHSANCT